MSEKTNHVSFKTVIYPQLKEALQSSGMTPPELSKKLGVSPLCAWRWTTGKNEFSIGVIKAILAVTGLTFEGNFCDIAQCKEIPCPYNGECSQREVWERLKAYEDTGLTPERCAEFARADAEGRYIVMRDADQEGVARLRELAEADKDGRVVVLPCKVGDTVYFRTYDCNGTVDLGIQPHKVTAIVGHAIVRGKYTDVGLLPAQYGVSWFLTREEAEAALEVIPNE